jgi:HEAT repeat protein
MKKMTNKRQLIILVGILFLIAVPAVFSSDVDNKVDSLFIIASSGEIRYRDMVKPAIDSIAAMGEKAVPRMIEKYDTKDARESHAVSNILEKIGSPAVPYLLEALNVDDAEKISRICYTLGNIKDSSAVDGIIDVCENDDWRARSGAVGALGKIGDRRADETVIRFLSDSVETVRKSAAVAAGRLMIEDAARSLVHMLGDSFYGARMTASESLVKLGEKAIESIADSLDSENEMVGNLGCTTLGNIGGIAAAYAIAPQLESESIIRRTMAVEGIYLSNSSLACGFVELMADNETDPTVRFFIEQVIEKYATR